jgi:ring-1,2-phenylacetyl-CoA epoxidase subunit PaaC
MAFERDWNEFTCCRMVTYPRGDFAYTVVRQYLFDEAEQVRLRALSKSTYEPLKHAAAKILREETYHLLHSKGLVERLGDGTPESHSRMQNALDLAFPQSLGVFEELEGETELARHGIFPGNEELKNEWLQQVAGVLKNATLRPPVSSGSELTKVSWKGDLGGSKRKHTEHLQQLVEDMQQVFRSVPGGAW